MQGAGLQQRRQSGLYAREGSRAPQPLVTALCALGWDRVGRQKEERGAKFEATTPLTVEGGACTQMGSRKGRPLEVAWLGALCPGGLPYCPSPGLKAWRS